jgi:UDP-N-acetylmuramate--alanine ligase
MGNIVLIWAGGTGMSGIAWILHDLWFSNIVCIDSTQSETTEKLEKKWIHVIIGHDKYTPQADDNIIYSEATAECNEIKQARIVARAANKIPLILNYFQFLWEISKYFISVWFAWTNGKSSSTALAIYWAKDNLPTFAWGILGALVPDLWGESYYLNQEIKDDIKIIFDFIFIGNTGKSPKEIYTKNLIKKYYFFIEACEWRRHFLYLDLDYTLISSLELDHTDYYKDREDYLDAFKTLILKTKNTVYIPETLKNFFPEEKKIKSIQQQQIPFLHIFGEHNSINW